jgi:peptide/nickel transport system substrate-binding protein
VRLAAASFAAALSLSVAGCAAASPPVDAPDTIRIGVDPSLIAGSYAPLNLNLSVTLTERALYEGLFSPNSSTELGGFEPVLATGYERSDDWKTITVTLRDDVTFVDGERFTAQGLETYLEGMAATEGWWFNYYWGVNSPTLTALDDTTLEITSDKPMSLIFQQFVHMLFTQVPILSPNVLDDLETEQPAGTGPYVLASSTPEVGATLARNKGYWNPEAYPFDTIELTSFADEVAALNALTSGQIDAASVSPSLAVEAKNQGMTLNLSSANGGVDALFISDREGTVVPALADKRVRQAIALAFDREAINDALNFGYGVITSQPFIDTQAEYVEGGDDRYAYDPERAKELLADAGYPDGFDLPILCSIASAYVPVVTQSLADIGIRATIDCLEVGAFYEAASNPSKYGVMLGGGVAPILVPIYVAPNGFLNAFKVQDPEVDERWAAMLNGPDEVAEKAAAELGEYVVDQSMFAVFASTKGIWVTAPGFVCPWVFATPELSDFAYTG